MTERRDESAADGDGGRLVPVADAAFGVDLLGVGRDGAQAAEEGRRDLLAGAAGDEEVEHLALAAGEVGVVRGAAQIGRGCRDEGQELAGPVEGLVE
ncbi:MAG TPA: hypothetical protein VH482_04875 [Thermomicrobiales bacterium]